MNQGLAKEFVFLGSASILVARVWRRKMPGEELVKPKHV
jgi:hypothetical protein